MIQFEPLFQYIEENLHRKINMLEVADVTSFSPAHLSRLFRFAYGMTPAEYIRKRRLTASVAALQDKSPGIRLLGSWHDIPYKDSVRMAPETAFDFWDNTRPLELSGKDD